MAQLGALQAHIEMADRAPYRKRLQQHLKETRNHATLVERRMKKLGDGGHLLQDVTEALAETLGDRETAKVARQIRREEERMATFLARQTPILTRAALRAEAPHRGALVARPRTARGRAWG